MFPAPKTPFIVLMDFSRRLSGDVLLHVNARFTVLPAAAGKTADQRSTDLGGMRLLATRSEQPQTAEGRGCIGSCPLTRPLATLSPQTGEGVLEFDRTWNFVGRK